MDELWQLYLAGKPGLVPLVADVICSSETVEQPPLSLLGCSGYREGVPLKWACLAALTRGVHNVFGFVGADSLGEGFQVACFLFLAQTNLTRAMGNLIEGDGGCVAMVVAFVGGKFIEFDKVARRFRER